MTIADFAQNAVRQYLRSVVLIDDNLFLVPRVTVSNETLTVEGAPALGTVVGNTSSVQDSVVARDDGQREETLRLNKIDAHAVTNGFAREGIICGVYKPVAFPETDFENDVNFKTLLIVCKNADVFILDWNLFAENENAVTLLLRRLLHDDNEADSPKPVRFCAIYTAERVDVILDKVFSALKTEDPLAQKDDVKFNLRAGGLTVYVYGKEAATSPCAVQAEDLAKRIITDFAKTYEGIMPALALRGIASIRDNTKRILDKFPAGMDPAFVLHAGLTIEGKGISEDVVNLIGDELSAVLADTQVKSDEIYDLCGDHIVTGCDETVLANLKADTSLVPTEVTWQNIKEFFVGIFSSRGLPMKTDVFLPWKKRIQLHKIDRKLLAALSDLVRRKASGDKAYQFGALSALFCHRTNYIANKMLRFGSVVKCMAPEENAGLYYLCLMPLCDSIRLNDRDKSGRLNNHKFPFWQLTEVSKEYQGRNHGLVLKGADGEFHPYCAKGKIRESFSLFEFNSQNSIVPFDANGVVKTAGATHTFEWIAELKSAHIQRMAEFVSREFSRVGLTESEWLRLQVDR